eukprot:364238-Chlamydomonas_euryale.AAC.7
MRRQKAAKQTQHGLYSASLPCCWFLLMKLEASAAAATKSTAAAALNGTLNGTCDRLWPLHALAGRLAVRPFDTQSALTGLRHLLGTCTRWAAAPARAVTPSSAHPLVRRCAPSLWRRPTARAAARPRRGGPRAPPAAPRVPHRRPAAVDTPPRTGGCAHAAAAQAALSAPTACP